MSDPHMQTILGAFWDFTREPKSVQKLIALPDGDKISLEITTPAGWKETDLTVVLVHGLCGSHASPVLVRVASRLEKLGIRAVRFNMRGCGSGKGLSKQLYHSGRSEDVLACLQTLKSEHPLSEIILAGVSLGANLSLKLAGELGALGNQFLKGVIAISPPIDPHAVCLGLSKPENLAYEKYFCRTIKAELADLHKTYRDLPPIDFPKRHMPLYELDELYTVPMYGFPSLDAYYSYCSPIHKMGEIVLPCRILFAEDDPIIPHHLLDSHQLPENIDLFKTKKGGHLGFIGRSEEFEGAFWLDSLLIDWILKF